MAAKATISSNKEQNEDHSNKAGSSTTTVVVEEKKTLPPNFEVESVKVEQVAHRGWSFITQKRHILDSNELDIWSNELHIPVLPEMIFGYNQMSFKKVITIPTTEAPYKILFTYSFDAKSGLKLCSGQPAKIKLAFSKNWKESNKGQVEKIKNSTQDSSTLDYDWTYSTPYTGDISYIVQDQNNIDVSKTTTFIKNPNFGVGVETTETMDLERLKKQDPIITFSEIMLFEDELGDNGGALLSVKMRVMKDYYYCLVRYYLRVDDVLFRIYDTRVFHDFNTDYILREFQHREDDFQRIRKMIHPGSFTDSNIVYNYLTLRRRLCERISINPFHSETKVS